MLAVRYDIYMSLGVKVLIVAAEVNIKVVDFYFLFWSLSSLWMLCRFWLQCIPTRKHTCTIR
jgi:hypothetical protein